VSAGRALQLLAAAFLAAGSARAPGSGLALSVDPPRQELRAAPGREATATLEVRNPGDAPVTLRLKAEPFSVDEGGNVAAGRAAAGPHDATEWLRVSPSGTVVAPGESAVVRVTARPPEGARGTYWSLVYAETVGSEPGGGARGPEPVGMGLRLGSFLYVTVGDSGPAAADADLSASRDAEGALARATIVHVSGGVLRLRAAWRAVDARGAAVADAEEEIAVLPAGRRRLTWRPAGAGVARVFLALTGSVTLRREAPVAGGSPPP
jgi:hypothetical protein